MQNPYSNNFEGIGQHHATLQQQYGARADAEHQLQSSRIEDMYVHAPVRGYQTMPIMPSSSTQPAASGPRQLDHAEEVP